MAKKESAESTVRNIRRNTRKKYGAEEKIRIVLEGLKGKSTMDDIFQCRQLYNFYSVGCAFGLYQGY